MVEGPVLHDQDDKGFDGSVDFVLLFVRLEL